VAADAGGVNGAGRAWARRALCALGMAWTAPNTAIGLIAGALAMARGARPRLRPGDYALAFHGVPWGPGGALTLGNVILHTGADLGERCWTYARAAGDAGDAPIAMNDHERAHVLQYMAFGPLFLPLYFACGGVRGGNRFERAADRYAMTGRGWWPWNID
jgi:hypothetical protein